MGQDAPEFERIVEFSPAYDRGKEGGVHGVDLRMILKGPLGATQFVLFTGWHLTLATGDVGYPYDTKIRPPQPCDIGYHSAVPRYDGQMPMMGEQVCKYLPDPTKPCHYDGSSLQAYEVFAILVREGSEGVWRELERRYRMWLTPASTEAA